MAYDPLQCVRDSCEDVMKRAVDVSIDDDKLKLLAEELAPNATFNPFASHSPALTCHTPTFSPQLPPPLTRQPPVEGL